MIDRFDDKVLEEQRRKKAFYVFKTIVSVARLAGFRAEEPIRIRDFNGTVYDSKDFISNV